MTRRQRNMAVEAHADLILADTPSVEAYAAYFEAQMYCGKLRRMLYTSYLRFARLAISRNPHRAQEARNGTV
jgi:hypothetical protein